jgi:hypothetical protein
LDGERHRESLSVLFNEGGSPMGAWSHGSFDNDDALDWVGELQDADGIEPISDAFEAVLGVDDYLEAPEASMGLAAAEVVAALLGKPAAKLPNEVVAWVVGKKPPKPTLVKKAQRVVKRILKDSELKELWAESEDSDKWQQEVQSLLNRLEDNRSRGSS